MKEGIDLSELKKMPFGFASKNAQLKKVIEDIKKAKGKEGKK